MVDEFVAIVGTEIAILGIPEVRADVVRKAARLDVQDLAHGRAARRTERRHSVLTSATRLRFLRHHAPHARAPGRPLRLERRVARAIAGGVLTRAEQARSSSRSRTCARRWRTTCRSTRRRARAPSCPTLSGASRAPCTGDNTHGSCRLRFMVHNGRTYTPVTVSQDMVGHKLGEFSHTRKVFTYKCVLLGSLSPWRAADGTTGRRRTGRALRCPVRGYFCRACLLCFPGLCTLQCYYAISP
jgi:hypothetical protein